MIFARDTNPNDGNGKRDGDKIWGGLSLKEELICEYLEQKNDGLAKAERSGLHLVRDCITITMNEMV